MHFIEAVFIGYLLGSFPTAYLFVKIVSRIDIRNAGSGNVGGRNALEVTGKKWIGVAVVTIDILKGFLAAAAGYSFGMPIFLFLSMNGAVLGHCYPVWLKFKGGRGLATAAGVFLFAAWIVVPVWLILYFLLEKILKNIHIASAIALIAVPIFCFLIPEDVLRNFVFIPIGKMELLIAGSIVCFISLTRHLPPILETLKNGSASA